MSQHIAVVLIQLRRLQAFYDGVKLKLRWFQDSGTTWAPVGEYKGLSTLHRKCPCHHNPVWIHIFITDIFYIYKYTYIKKKRKSPTIWNSSRHLRKEMNNASLPLISLSGAETAQALSQNLSQTSERGASSIKRASSTDFSFYLGGPLQRPDPLRFHIFVPTPVIWLRSTRNTPHVSRCSSCAIYLDFSAFAPSLSSLLMRSEFFFWNIMMWSPGQGCKWNAHFGAESIHKKQGGCEGSQDETMR